MVKKIWLVAASVLLILLGAGGLQGLWNNLGTSETLFQQSINVAQFLLGVAGIAAGVGALLRRSWAGPAALVFALGMAYAAGAGPVAWGEVGWPRGMLEGGIIFLVAFVLFLGVRGAGRGDSAQGAQPEETPEAS